MMTRTEKMGTTVGTHGLERVGMPVSSSSLEQAELVEWGSGPQKRGREEEDDEEGEANKCWNCTRRKVECTWPR